MPKAYESMRDKFIQQGLSEKSAKSKAARIYNSKHPESPVTGKHEGYRERLRKVTGK